ncbi:hypothetical protein MQC88_06605 [Luteimonas sp. 50]|uniref:Transmembrane protein n=1 Tax=Cognatiluteimonas sedimenti TaxID=2927791 RepID=A0ABT0A3S8_9GAMM|nr:DUF6776 family protein [Lysobacter sedimenti]MCJ0825629.1 hypothetical protein [Lysobacter sedimenti]
MSAPPPSQPPPQAPDPASTTSVVESAVEAAEASLDIPVTHGHGIAYALVAVFLLAVVFGVWGVWTVLAPQSTDQGAVVAAQQARLDEMEQRAATLARSDQISREANRDLQGTLAERDEEIAGLRADVAFYERLVGSTAKRHGLNVHQLQLQPQGGPAWHFTATLTQNLNRGAVNSGRLTLSLEGSRDGKLQKLSWEQLRQQPGAAGLEYSFKYFQQVEGDVLLPSGLQPVRIIARLAPARGNPVEQSFTWAEAASKAETGAP